MEKNKYQEALDLIRNDCNGGRPKLTQSKGNELLDTLQELIDIINQPVRIYGNEATEVISLDEYHRMEKALDKACKCMSNGNCCNGQLHYCKNDDPITITKCYNCWKE